MGTLFSLIGLSNARGQSIAPNIFNASGGSVLVGGIYYDFSIAEVSLVSTVYDTSIVNSTKDTLIVTQGLLQNDISFPASVPNTQLSQHLLVFPNPASSVVNVQYTASLSGVLSYRLMDMNSKVVIENSSNVSSGTNKEQINISNLAVATYMLEVTVKSESNNPQTTTYKIQKLK
jgi:hypothetical protein